MFLSASPLPALDVPVGRLEAGVERERADQRAVQDDGQPSAHVVPQANALHLLFDRLATATLDRADELAERIASLGALAQATPAIIARTDPEAAAYPVDQVDGLAHVRTLVARYLAYGARLRTAHAACKAVDDFATVQLLEVQIEAAEHESWFLSAHIDATTPPPA